jgi:hypothetical protein
MITHELITFGLNDMEKIINFNLFQIMNIFKINDIIIKMDNYEHQIEFSRLGSIYKKLSLPIYAIKHLLPPPHTHNMQNGVGVPP